LSISNLKFKANFPDFMEIPSFYRDPFTIYNPLNGWFHPNMMVFFRCNSEFFFLNLSIHYENIKAQKVLFDKPQVFRSVVIG